MPELPEVEVTRRGLLEQLPGRTVTAVSWSAHRLRSAIPHQLLREEIAGQQIRTVDRRAKYLLVRMASGAVLVIHLGMTGKLGVIERQTAPHKHDHLLLELDNGLDLRFNDSRRFGVVLVWLAEKAAQCEENFSLKEGLEPFGDDFTAKTLHALAQHRRIPVKALLMTSRLIAGIGNIYANEILFAARIHPLTPANQLPPAAWRLVVKETRRILQQAIDAGGSTISDFLGASGHPGYFQLQLAVYGRKDSPCLRCGQPIVKTTLAGRATFHCPACQHG
ncbi:bifunctional DNA-formamidopyrimidine glycosylase/DNA-(apurinic or apyrimidinic site) lyase [Desulfobulbus sp.]|uniref:bifunctional DNA-formamidopyrimidine glycosylase/DNA-(apurinic or apyrimidinic site) lyase n=1 Tax=Desulfobulbus sp. TaxID=895 RepID=UPI0027B97BE9|nr:bifunctional DNA-formamidopyrimidine glycosylase/DNA-(apurinic or apyrimidinic site) lyase [Desulfobulbus sp.]